ncbi:MAG: hypothetical protein NT009_07075 [Proteobacteria bacterium]|nr:hypothetical protein [Pseudomonadota bacterium]
MNKEGWWDKYSWVTEKVGGQKARFRKICESVFEPAETALRFIQGYLDEYSPEKIQRFRK